MKNSYNELVGLVVTHNKLLDLFSVDYVYQRMENGVLVEVATQKGFDWPLHISFARITKNLESAYAPAIEKLWTQETSIADQQYQQFYRHATPSALGLTGDWKLIAEK